MAKQERQQVSYRPQVAQQQGGRQVKSQAAATGMDMVPYRSFFRPERDDTLQGFLSGLSSIQPGLQKALQAEQDKNAQQAETDRLGGAEAQSTEPSYTQAYFRTDGLVRAQQDGSALMARYQTEFDKDGGDLEKWLGEQYGSGTKGITDKDYIAGYSKGLDPALQAIRKEHLTYQHNKVVGRVESNAMQMLNSGITAYLSGGVDVPEGYIMSIRDYMGKNLGISQQRFDELLFETAKTLGDKGNIDAFDLLQKDHPDGTPGLYNNPAWRGKIDNAIASSYSVFHTRSQQERDRRQNEALFPVFMEEDPKKAAAMFSEMKKGGLFSRADDLIKWDKLLMEKVDGKPDFAQLDAEGDLLARAYQGKLSYREILDANAKGTITAGQRKYLLGEVRRVQNENRTAAAAEAKQESAIYRSREFKDAEDFLKGILKPRQKDYTDPGPEFDHAQLAQARREFSRAAAGKKPEELGALADEITQRYLSRRKGYTYDQQTRTGSGEMPFKTLQEARDAAANGLLSTAEFRAYIDHFKNQQQTAPRGGS